jgi:putative membrane protein insertion efficiency factor
MRHALLLLIQVYRWVLSPLKVALAGPAARCRFEPSCSEYALEAVRLHGAYHGARLALGRVARCHPWGGCGCDPVPARIGNSARGGERPTTIGMASAPTPDVPLN